MASYAATDAFITNMQNSSSAMEAITWSGGSTNAATTTTGGSTNGYQIYDSTKIGMGISGILSGISSIYNTISARKVYAMYQKQEQAYIERALKQSEREQLRGDIAMVSMRAEHAAYRGRNKLAVAAAGGNLSGSFLDKLMQNYQYNVMDERSQSLETLWQVSNTKMQGYNNAISTAAKATAAAYAQRDAAINSLLGFTLNSAKSAIADIQQQEKIDYLQETKVNQQQKIYDIQNEQLYGVSSSSLLKLNNGTSSSNQSRLWNDISI